MAATKSSRQLKPRRNSEFRLFASDSFVWRAGLFLHVVSSSMSVGWCSRAKCAHTNAGRRVVPPNAVDVFSGPTSRRGQILSPALRRRCPSARACVALRPYRHIVRINGSQSAVTDYGRLSAVIAAIMLFVVVIAVSKRPHMDGRPWAARRFFLERTSAATDSRQLSEASDGWGRFRGSPAGSAD